MCTATATQGSELWKSKVMSLCETMSMDAQHKLRVDHEAWCDGKIRVYHGLLDTSTSSAAAKERKARAAMSATLLLILGPESLSRVCID